MDTQRLIASFIAAIAVVGFFVAICGAGVLALKMFGPVWLIVYLLLLLVGLFTFIIYGDQSL